MNIEELNKKLEDNTNLIIQNMNRLHSHEEKINENANKIQKNSGALELLHTINNVKKRFFIMWASTFLLLICSICLNVLLFIFLLFR